MCGITVRVKRIGHDANEPLDESLEWDGLVKQNAARGPDLQRRKDIFVSEISLCFLVSTLHLRGPVPVPQPHVSDRGIFSWNGEVFEGLDIPSTQNDGSILFSTLEATETPEEVCAVMSKIEGPYAFVFYQQKTKKLFFARDPLGRRSLLICRPNPSNPVLILSSVSASTRGGYEEIDTRHIHCLDIHRLSNSGMISQSFDSCLTALERMGLDRPVLFGNLARVNTSVPGEPEKIDVSRPLPDDLILSIQHFTEVLDRSVRLRVQNIPLPYHNHNVARVGILYSGGIDCTMIAFLANRHVPLDEPIDLLNVAFENPRKLRIRNGHKLTRGKHRQNSLIQRDVVCREDAYMVPDRIAGLEQLEELRKLCPERRWNFIEIDVDYTESSSAKKIVESIMFPSSTVMDLSLALALYFASRGIGKIRNTASGVPEPYTSKARVLLNGLGADELFGGYSRHRAVFHTGGWPALVEELQLELDRLPTRNLGRDDRVISSHGKETRLPFLSLAVVDFVARLPVHFKVDPRLELGLGDKMLLRLAARGLGLELASMRKKRAMQFGSCSARMDDGVDTSGERSPGC